MHTTNALAVLSSVIFFTTSTFARVVPPQPPVFSSPAPVLRRSIPVSQSPLAESADGTCTFTLYHKQVSKVNYVQINTLVDHANDIAIDLAQLRPSGERNSYAKISKKRVFAVEGLLDNTNLTVRGEDGKSTVSFESDGVSWTSETRSEGAWCGVGAWVESGKTGRERKMECAFSCGKIDSDDEEREELR